MAEQSIAFNYMTGAFFVAQLDHGTGGKSGGGEEPPPPIVGLVGYRVQIDASGRAQSDVAELRYLLVDPRFRGRGLGAVLLDCAYAHAYKRKYKEMAVVRPSVSQAPAARFQCRLLKRMLFCGALSFP